MNKTILSDQTVKKICRVFTFFDMLNTYLGISVGGWQIPMHCAGYTKMSEVNMVPRLTELREWT